MGKGGSWERDVCKSLSKWVNGTEKPYVFWRGAGSGSVFTKNNLVGERFAGDVYSVRDEGKFLTDIFSLECKSGYKDASFDKHLKYNKNDEIKDFWEQASTDAQLTNKEPMLIYKKKGFKNPWIGITENVYKKLKSYLKTERFIHLKWENELPDCYMFEKKRFFKLITPDIIKKLK